MPAISSLIAHTHADRQRKQGHVAAGRQAALCGLVKLVFTPLGSGFYCWAVEKPFSAGSPQPDQKQTNSTCSAEAIK